MQNRLTSNVAVLLTSIVLIFVGAEQSRAQSDQSSNAVLSPYTMYGIGDLIPLGSASTMSMGGVGIGMRSPVEINYLNPASLSWMARNTTLFSFGARGNNYYSKSPYGKTAYNNFDISDLGLSLPIARGFGMSFSLNQVTAVGYKSVVIDSTSNIVDNIGRTVYNYDGYGGISQVSMGMGLLIVQGFSVGMNINYYFGNLTRNSNTTVSPMLGQSTPYRIIFSHSNTHVSSFHFNFGAQYSHRMGKYSNLTLGATYQPGMLINSKRSEEMFVVGTNTLDTISSGNTIYPINVPSKYGVGLFFIGHRFTVGLDWTMQDWSNAFELNTSQKMSLQTQSDLKFGLSYTPDRSNLNNVFKRWTYKAGFHYSESYLVKDNTPLKDRGFTFGVDVPLRRDNNYVSKATFGVDFGKRGLNKIGQVSDNYFKIYVGINLFSGDIGDLWFHKQKFQ